jgi:hypothetical protein
MAAAWLAHLAAGRVEVRSAGSAPADQVNPAAVEAMAEVGIDISANEPKVLTPESVEASDVCVTMGCGDACPVFPGKLYLDWKLDDPAGQLLARHVQPCIDRDLHEDVPAARVDARSPRGADHCCKPPPSEPKLTGEHRLVYRVAGKGDAQQLEIAAETTNESCPSS